MCRERSQLCLPGFRAPIYIEPKLFLSVVGKQLKGAKEFGFDRNYDSHWRVLRPNHCGNRQNLASELLLMALYYRKLPA